MQAIAIATATLEHISRYDVYQGERRVLSRRLFQEAVSVPTAGAPQVTTLRMLAAILAKSFLEFPPAECFDPERL